MKEYLKMNDCFDMPLEVHATDGGAFVIMQSSGFGVQAEFECNAEADSILHAINSHDELVADKTELLAALKDLSKAYVRLLESGKDRIESLGGDCDDVCYMAAHDSDLVKACSVIGRHDQ